MSDTVDCPYCGHENDMSHALTDGLSSNNTFDHECEECETEFEVYVEFEPSYTSSEILYEPCQKCGSEERDIYKKGRVFPFPEALQHTKVCKKCYMEAIAAEYSK
ncbi:hypothetical protein AMQ84_27145 [Paenibacillus riograndensis]|uniref:Uncharacterized protein n=1 Tax=Paenibacillus riograndensis TaxID=483937 RepID=A0A132TJX3_9BACL|nr:hypothetical protein [Paenibacillus riograndensis]KWX71601.1 hypothetical protein AMQ84_27145 [Paenibacillus riograndensis]